MSAYYNLEGVLKKNFEHSSVRMFANAFEILEEGFASGEENKSAHSQPSHINLLQNKN